MTERSLPEEIIFAQALELGSAAERAAFLDRACRDNPALRTAVESPCADARAGDLLYRPERSASPPLGVERPGAVQGPDSFPAEAMTARNPPRRESGRSRCNPWAGLGRRPSSVRPDLTAEIEPIGPDQPARAGWLDHAARTSHARARWPERRGARSLRREDRPWAASAVGSPTSPAARTLHRDRRSSVRPRVATERGDPAPSGSESWVLVKRPECLSGWLPSSYSLSEVFHVRLTRSTENATAKCATDAAPARGARRSSAALDVQSQYHAGHRRREPPERQGRHRSYLAPFGHHKAADARRG